MSSIIRKEDLVQALGGGQGGLCALLLTLPIESVQKMQVTAVGKPPTVAECCRAIFRTGGNVTLDRHQLDWTTFGAAGQSHCLSSRCRWLLAWPPTARAAGFR